MSNALNPAPLYRFDVGIGDTLDGPALTTVTVEATSDEAAVMIVQTNHTAPDGGPAFIASVAMVAAGCNYCERIDTGRDDTTGRCVAGTGCNR